MRIKRVGRINKSQRRNLIKKAPQLKGIILKLITMTPKKPNSALRKVALVKLTKPVRTSLKKLEDQVLAYITGEKHTLNIHNTVLLIAKKTQDLPGVNYKLLRGVLDSKAPIRKNSRSKYGTKKII